MLGMNRSDLVAELALRFPNLAKSDAGLVLDAILDALADAMAAGSRIEIRGFGSFSIKQRVARIRRNPRNGDSVAVPERRVAHFKPGKALRESVDKRTMPTGASAHR
jgi:integration host factor subunit beta